MENAYMNFYIEEGILFGTPKKEFKVNMKTSMVMDKARFELCNGKSYPTFIDIGTIKYADRQVREYHDTVSSKGVLAWAYYTTNPSSRIFINLLIMVSNSKIPSKCFSNKEAAIKWLKGYVRE